MGVKGSFLAGLRFSSSRGTFLLRPRRAGIGPANAGKTFSSSPSILPSPSNSSLVNVFAVKCLW